MVKKLFSMQAAVIMMVLFGVIIGAATFIENDYGTQTARALVYKAKWFELFLAYFIAILIYQILRYKTYKTKFPVFLFHFAFVLIAIGALITRYFGYEGIMHLREGETSDRMVSDVKVLQLAATENNRTVATEKTVFFSSMTSNRQHFSLNIDGKHVTADVVDYLPVDETKVVEDPDGKAILQMKVAAGKAGKFHYIEDGKIEDFGAFYIAYNVKNLPTDKPTFAVYGTPDNLQVNFPFIIRTMSMDTREQKDLSPGKNPLHTRTLYRFGNYAVVLKKAYAHAKTLHTSSKLKSKSGEPEYVKMRVCVEKKCQDIVLNPVKGEPGKLHETRLNDVDVQLRLGAKVLTLPFAIKLDDFKLERYPGSMTPASYSSYVTLIDKEQNLTMPYHIYMNHVLDHRFYRFFQSSYDPDEKGSVFSVNHDPGTLPTYLGYLLLAIGMLWSLFIPNGRFQKLLKNTRKLQENALGILAASVVILGSVSLHAAEPDINATALEHMKKYDATHALHFGTLAVQDRMGRMKPVDTLAHEVIRKVTGKSTIYGIDPTQLFLGMIMEPDFYQKIPMIKIGHPKIAKKLGLPKETKYAAFADFFDPKTNAYKLLDDISEAMRKKPLEQSAYDKELIKTDERVNVVYMTYQGSLLRIYPVPNDPNNKWVAPMEALKTFPAKPAYEVRLTIGAYFAAVAEGVKTGKWKHADMAVDAIKVYQKKYGAAVLPSEEHIKWEIWYNKLGLFSKLFPLYLMTGLVLLIFAFVHVLKPTFSLKWVMRIGWTLLLVGFALHIAGMAIRWYISGHAPWSNAYESIVFIAAATVLAGIILARRSPFALAGTALLAGFTMLVAHMSFINPEITNLVPVLKSYWLMIHVATIISGDGFLGLGSILSLLVLILFILRGKNGHVEIDRSIKELTNLSEMSLIIGLMLLTVGNFLGGVWANESWGRYWGWDSKETWAAVTILIYAAVLHMRFVPRLNDTFLFTVAATWAYGTVLMTYFGVNYYLSGLHSYAAGDPLPIPVWVYYAVATLGILTLLAARHRKLSA